MSISDVLRHTIDLNKCEEDFAYLMPFGDLHYGHKQYYGELFDEYLQWALKKDNCRVITMGYLLETGVKTSYGLFDQKFFLTKQFKDMKKTLKPLVKQNKLLGMLDGNHEARVTKRTGLDMTEMLADSLKVPYLGVGKFIEITVIKNDDLQRYTFYATHGSSSAWTLGGKINAGLRFTNGYSCDCLLHAHIHLLFAFPLTKYIPEGDDVVISETKIVFTGSFVKHWGTYAHAKGLPPTSLGCPRIELHTDKKKMVVKL